jgi:hypothetical protein
MNKYHSHPTGARKARCVPVFEALEDRSLLSCSAVFQAGVLSVCGTNKSDHIVIEDHGNNDSTQQVRVFCNGHLVKQVEGDLVNAIRVNTRDGNDTVEYKLVNILVGAAGPNGTNLGRDVSVNFGKGNSTFVADLEQILGRAQLNINVVGGKGNDTMIANLHGDIYLGDVHIRFDGQKATRVTEVLNAAFYDYTPPDVSPGIDIGVASSLTTTFLGSKGNDTIIEDYSGLLNGTLNLFADGGLGHDLIGFNVALDPGSGFNGGSPTNPQPVLALQENGSNTLIWNVNATPASLANIDHQVLEVFGGQDGPNNLVDTGNVHPQVHNVP